MVRKIVVFITGFTVLAVGIALIVLPGPAIIVIPAGLAILATEFLWARKLLNRLKEKASSVRNTVLKKNEKAIKTEDEVPGSR